MITLIMYTLFTTGQLLGVGGPFYMHVLGLVALFHALLYLLASSAAMLALNQRSKSLGFCYGVYELQPEEDEPECKLTGSNARLIEVPPLAAPLDKGMHVRTSSQGSHRQVSVSEGSASWLAGFGSRRALSHSLQFGSMAAHSENTDVAGAVDVAGTAEPQDDSREFLEERGHSLSKSHGSLRRQLLSHASITHGPQSPTVKQAGRRAAGPVAEAKEEGNEASSGRITYGSVSSKQSVSRAPLNIEVAPSSGQHRLTGDGLMDTAASPSQGEEAYGGTIEMGHDAASGSAHADAQPQLASSLSPTAPKSLSLRAQQTQSLTPRGQGMGPSGVVYGVAHVAGPPAAAAGATGGGGGARGDSMAVDGDMHGAHGVDAHGDGPWERVEVAAGVVGSETMRLLPQEVRMHTHITTKAHAASHLDTHGA